MTDADLEEIVADLAYRLKQARPGSAEARLIWRELQGLLPSEMGQLYMEDHGIPTPVASIQGLGRRRSCCYRDGQPGSSRDDTHSRPNPARRARAHQ